MCVLLSNSVSQAAISKTVEDEMNAPRQKETAMQNLSIEKNKVLVQQFIKCTNHNTRFVLSFAHDSSLPSSRTCLASSARSIATHVVICTISSASPFPLGPSMYHK